MNTKIILVIFVVLSSQVYATHYEYDSLHRLTRTVYDNGMEIVYSYDEAGNRTQRTVFYQADINIDGSVNLSDFQSVASKWMETNCSESNWCNGADYDRNNSVDIGDLLFIAEQWLSKIGF